MHLRKMNFPAGAMKHEFGRTSEIILSADIVVPLNEFQLRGCRCWSGVRQITTCLFEQGKPHDSTVKIDPFTSQMTP